MPNHKHDGGFYITSTSIDRTGRFHRQCTADGSAQQHDLSPALAWHGVPEGTASLALIMEDVDEPGTVTHW